MEEFGNFVIKNFDFEELQLNNYHIQNFVRNQKRTLAILVDTSATNIFKFLIRLEKSEALLPITKKSLLRSFKESQRIPKAQVAITSFVYLLNASDNSTFTISSFLF